jgi:hypothetical protein
VRRPIQCLSQSRVNRFNTERPKTSVRLTTWTPCTASALRLCIKPWSLARDVKAAAEGSGRDHSCATGRMRVRGAHRRTGRHARTRSARCPPPLPCKRSTPAAAQRPLRQSAALSRLPSTPKWRQGISWQGRMLYNFVWRTLLKRFARDAVRSWSALLILYHDSIYLRLGIGIG